MSVPMRYDISSIVYATEAADIPSRAVGQVRVQRDKDSATVRIQREGETLDLILHVGWDTPGPVVLDHMLMWLFGRPVPRS